MSLDVSYDGKRHEESRTVINTVSCARQCFILGILCVCAQVQNWSEVLNFNFGCMDSTVQIEEEVLEDRNCDGGMALIKIWEY